ncbi:MAG: PilZ domain-containing protein [candidate division NC10 bacterium]
MPDSSERREFGRYLIVLPILHKPEDPAAGSVGVGWTRNVGEGGTCVDLAESLRLQTPLRVRLQTDQGTIELEAHVAWAGEPSPGGGGIRHGLAFAPISHEQHQALQDLLVSKGEKRLAGVRLPLDLSVTCQPRGSEGVSVQGRTGNMSRGGMLLHLSEPIPPETVLEITLHTPQGPLTAEGEVVWVEPPEKRTPGEPIRHGLQFTVLGWSTSLSLGLFLVAEVDENAPQQKGHPGGQPHA